MDNTPGKLLFVYALATLLAFVLALALMRRVRAALLRLMRAPLAPGKPVADAVDLAQATLALPAWLAPALPDAARWRRAEWRLAALLAGLSLLMAATRGALVGAQMFGETISLTRWLTLSLVYAWPLLPALALMRRWSAWQLALALSLWFAACVPFLMWRSTEAQAVNTVLAFLAFEIAPPALALLLLTSRATRAAAPWLWLPVALLLFAALLGIDGLAWMVEHALPALGPLLRFVDPVVAIALAALAGAALAWWPVKQASLALANLYRDKKVSDLMVVFSAAWILNLGFDAIGNGPVALLPLAWIALALWLWPRLLRGSAAARAPTLLVLRVFQHDARVNDLFDDVVERWRSVGNTVLIAGTDLVAQTLDVADLLDFVAGRLDARFVHRAGELPARLAAFDWQPDPDGRHRVNECYCHDSSWQVALAALVKRADLVLMDLRGFKQHNAGCRFELGVLARAAHLKRAVVLIDAHTDFLTAQSDAAAAPRGRFVWLELPPGLSRRAGARRTIAALAAAGESAPRATSPVLA